MKEEINEILKHLISKKAKGVKPTVVKTNINFEDYVEYI